MSQALLDPEQGLLLYQLAGNGGLDPYNIFLFPVCLMLPSLSLCIFVRKNVSAVTHPLASIMHGFPELFGVSKFTALRLWQGPPLPSGDKIVSTPMYYANSTGFSDSVCLKEGTEVVAATQVSDTRQALETLK